MPPLSRSVPSGRRGLAWALAFLFVVGAVLRLVWVQDMEYKQDEAWTFQQTQDVGHTRAFPWLGMPSSAGIDNPGMSLWVFLALGKLFAVQEPTALARAVELLSLAALVVWILFAVYAVPRTEREPWLWSAALLAVNPLAVLFQRKIWPPSVLPIFISLFIMGWWYRGRRWGAFLWGLLGACVGQIHMGGFFFAAGFALWAFLFERKLAAWRSWLLGSFLGALPLLPWFHHVFMEEHEKPLVHRTWVHLAEGKFWMRWAMEPLGFGLDYALQEDFPDFLRYPEVGGQPTFLAGMLHVVMALVGLTILLRAARRYWRARATEAVGTPGDSPSAFTLNAAFWGFGILLTLSMLPIHRHYMVIVYPLELLWLAWLALPPAPGALETRKRGRLLLGTLCLVQALLSASFLSYVHTHSQIHGDYGVPYREQWKG